MYIHSTHTKAKGWSDNSGQGMLAPVSKGQHAIITLAGVRAKIQ
jgi:hypothetical protein